MGGRVFGVWIGVWGSEDLIKVGFRSSRPDDERQRLKGEDMPSENRAVVSPLRKMRTCRPSAAIIVLLWWSMSPP